MPGSARRELIATGEIGVYHCTARCVRRAYLCGRDSLTGKSFEHRKEWAKHGLERLAGAFAVEISTFAIMDNHLHVILKQRPDIAASWSAKEVTIRWRTIFGKPPKSKTERESYDARVEMESADAKLVQQRRLRLASISWFMRCLCEPIARRANQEDNCTGRFWEGRFRSQALLDDAALLACSAYVDLNPVRSATAKTPESSVNTSAYERIRERQKPTHHAESSRDGWLAPMNSHAKYPKAGGRRATDEPMIALSLDEYLTLLDGTGRQIRLGKRGSIAKNLAPILIRLKIEPTNWVELVTNFGRWFRKAAGNPANMRQYANRNHVRSLVGIGPSRECFLET